MPDVLAFGAWCFAFGASLAAALCGCAYLLIPTAPGPTDAERRLLRLLARDRDARHLART